MYNPSQVTREIGANLTFPSFGLVISDDRVTPGH